MSRFLAILVFAALCRAQGLPSLQSILNFDGGQAGTAPAGWGTKSAAVSLDNQVLHEGKWSVRIERRTGDAGPFGGITALVPADFAGATVELRGYLRCEDVSGHLGMWMQLTDESGSLGFDILRKAALRPEPSRRISILKLCAYRWSASNRLAFTTVRATPINGCRQRSPI